MCLKLWCLSNIIRTIFTVNFVLQGIINCWVTLAVFMYNLAEWTNSTLGCTRCWAE
jgi:hypothetical protein